MRAREEEQSSVMRHTFLDSLGEVGEYTALIEMVFGHEDHFGPLAGALIENKMLMHRGPVDNWGTPNRLAQVPLLGPVPVGGLAIPRGKVATVIGAMQDVELHDLHGVVHMGRTPPVPYATHGSGVDAPSGASKHARKRARKAAMKADAGMSGIMHRACWRRNEDDSDGVSHLEGVGLADWNSAGR